MLENNSYDWDKTVTDPIPMVLNADKEYVKNKIEEIKERWAERIILSMKTRSLIRLGMAVAGREEPETGDICDGQHRYRESL
ncbi:MAG: hypothetical protein ACOX2X_05060 [Peptococcia bacterium]